MHHPNDQERWTKALQQHAARLAFPDWTPEPDDRPHAYTGFHDGAPYTEVAVYRNDTLIHYTLVTGDDLEPFWLAVINAHGET